jgi:hypothetical protein
MYENVFDVRRGRGSGGSFVLTASRHVTDFGASPKISLVIEETISSGTLDARFWIHSTEPGGNETVKSQNSSSLRLDHLRFDHR